MPIVLAWLAGYGIIAYRTIHDDRRPPMPGQLLAASGVFIGCALLGEAPGAAGLAAAMAWGFDLAAFLNLAPALTGGKTTTTSTAKKEAA